MLNSADLSLFLVPAALCACIAIAIAPVSATPSEKPKQEPILPAIASPTASEEKRIRDEQMRWSMAERVRNQWWFGWTDED